MLPRFSSNEPPLGRPVASLFGVGPKRSEQLARLGVATIGRLLWLRPRRHEDRTLITPAARAEHDQVQTFAGEIIDVEAKFIRRRRLNIFNALLQDDTGSVMLTWFNQSFRSEQVQVGMKLVVAGKVNVDRSDIPAITTPDFEELERLDRGLGVGRIVPIYPLTQGLTQSALRKLVWSALAVIDENPLADPLPAELIRELELMPLGSALRGMHFPESMEAAAGAVRRLAFDELFELQLWLARRRARAAANCGKSRRIEGAHKTQGFLDRLGFELTRDQVQALEAIRADMDGPRPMNRLLQGDVGCGKTLVAVAALLLGAENGAQGAFMAPTELLAEQHYLAMRGPVAEAGFEMRLLSASLKAGARKRIIDDLAQGRIHILIGTHALLSDDVVFRELGLAVVDEQHKFGVLQRARLAEKGRGADLLVMTATPIPRTLALTVYGDLDVTGIERMPPGRKPVKTRVVNDAKTVERMTAAVRGELEAGRRAFFVCPLVQESDKTPARSVTELAERIRARFPQWPCEIVHGRMGMEERESVMNRFRSGEVPILAATTVIEVGVDVPEATVMVVENAERFGLAQLHQLRGRVGRGGNPGYCFLIDRGSTEESRRRIKAMLATGDGFAIARRDLAIRGAGRVSGVEQSGRVSHFMIADLGEKWTRELVAVARARAFDIIKADPGLEAPGFEALRRRLGDLDRELELVETG